MGIAWGPWAFHTHLNTFLSVLKLCHLLCAGFCPQRSKMAAVEPDILSSKDGSERLVCSNILFECVFLAGKALKVTVIAMTSVHTYT